MKRLRFGLLLLVSCLFLSGCGCEKEKNEYKVSFDSNGGTAVSSQTVKENETATKPTDPTKEGFVFGGWYLNLSDESAYDFSTKVTKNITLYAKWSDGSANPDDNDKDTVKTFKVTFDADGGSDIKAKNVKVGQKIGELPVPTKDGYVFAGWYNGKTKVTENTVVKKNMKLTAKWTKNTTAEVSYQIKFDSKSGSAVASLTVKSGEKAVKPANPTRSGYNFAGWYLGEKLYDFSKPITSNITLTAKWNAIYTYTTTEIAESLGMQKGIKVYFGDEEITKTALKVYNNTKDVLGVFDKTNGFILVDSSVVEETNQVYINNAWIKITKK